MRYQAALLPDGFAPNAQRAAAATVKGILKRHCERSEAIQSDLATEIASSRRRTGISLGHLPAPSGGEALQAFNLFSAEARIHRWADASLGRAAGGGEADAGEAAKRLEALIGKRAAGMVAGEAVDQAAEGAADRV